MDLSSMRLQRVSHIGPFPLPPVIEPYDDPIKKCYTANCDVISIIIINSLAEHFTQDEDWYRTLTEANGHLYLGPPCKAQLQSLVDSQCSYILWYLRAVHEHIKDDASDLVRLIASVFWLCPDCRVSAHIHQQGVTLHLEKANSPRGRLAALAA